MSEERASKIMENGDAVVTDKSKQSFRVEVWEHLEQNKLVHFPLPVFGRIPNFRGADKAANKLTQLEEFKTAKTVEVNPDKPLEASRALVLENDKILYVPAPNLQEGLLKKISFCADDKPNSIRQIVTRWGMDNFGKSVSIDGKLRIDLLVLGSVAVSKSGLRIGKGKGFADLEYAILKEINAVDDSTTIVTTVHDTQVFDTLPAEIFGAHDVPVDYILTPTQIIKIEEKLPRPTGIYWNLLSQKRVNLMPVLQKVREIHLSEGRNPVLKETETDEEGDEKLPILQNHHQNRQKFDKSSHVNGVTKERYPKRRFFKKTKLSREPKENEDPANKENGENAIKVPRPKKFRSLRKGTRRLQTDFSLVVSNIDRNVRVRHLKDALIDRGIKPQNITWRGYKGFCYLHYAKAIKKVENEVVEEKPFAMDNVIEILQTLKLNPESENCLSVKIMEPITRIETTDVTAV